MQVLCFLFVVLINLVGCNDEAGSCFCKLEGKIDDCTCNVDTVDYFNNMKIYPRLKSILMSDYFRYIKMNLNRKCPFWPDDGKCSIKDCSVQTCPEEQLPPALKGNHRNFEVGPSIEKYTKYVQDESSCDENHGGLGSINETISKKYYEEFQKWQQHDDSQDNFCEMDDESSAEAQYVDLLLNPERYTGYKGHSAHRIWNSIYKENCFKFGAGYGPYTTSKNLNAMCLEKRTFFRAISGLHSSINIHLCSQYYTRSENGLTPGKWGANVVEFKRRFDPAYTDGEGVQWLRNLYFVYLLELSAIAKAAPYFETEVFYTGNVETDSELKVAVRGLLEIAKSFPDHFNESVMFSGDDDASRKMKEEFKQHFRNISRIMDCVGCDKCRLWGKLQVQGLGTAFKVLFSKNFDSPFSIRRKKFHLTRAEIVSLFNAFGRLSNSIFQLENFRKLLKHDHL